MYLQELLYFLYVFTFAWLLPFVVMLGSYLTIILTIYKRSQQHRTLSEDDRTASGHGVIGRAKLQTIKMTGVLVSGFILCWTPYNVMSLW